MKTVLSACMALAVLSKMALASSIAFYDKPANWFADIINNPKAKVTHFYSTPKVGCAMIDLGAELQCILYGKTIEFPKNSSEASYVRCSITADEIHAHIPAQSREANFGEIYFTGVGAHAVQPFLKTKVFSFRDKNRTITQKMTKFEEGGLVKCTEVVPDKVSLADPVTNQCEIAWEHSNL